MVRGSNLTGSRASRISTSCRFRTKSHCAFLTVLIFVVTSGNPEGLAAQSKTFEFGLRAAAALPTTNFVKLASPGVSAGIYGGWWNSDRLLVFFQATYDQFSEKTLEDGSTQTVAFLPVEFGVRYHPEMGTVGGFFVSLASGPMFGLGDFSGTKASISVGVGYSFPFTNNRLLIDATYRSEIADPFNSYLLVGLIYGFGSGG